MPTNDLVIVFEAINDYLKEIYVGITSVPMHELIQQYENEPPKVIAHWNKSQDVRYRGVEYSMPLAEAIAFLNEYVKDTGKTGWKVINQKDEVSRDKNGTKSN